MGHVAYKIDDDLHARAMAFAAYKGQTFKAWLERAILAAVEAQEDERREDPADDGYMGALPVVERTHDGLAVHDDGGESCLETTARVVRWILNQPGTPDSVTFEFACTCDQPRLAGFSGGAVKVTADTEAWIHTSDNAIDDLLDQIITESRALVASEDRASTPQTRRRRPRKTTPPRPSTRCWGCRTPHRGIRASPARDCEQARGTQRAKTHERGL